MLHLITCHEHKMPRLAELLLLLCFIEILVFNANSIDCDQMQHSVVSDLGLHCCGLTDLTILILNFKHCDSKNC